MTKRDEIEDDDVQFSSYSIKKIGQQAGVDRMSDSAALRVAYEQQREIQNLLQAAQIIANQAGRKTVREEDVIAVKEIVQKVNDV